MLLTTERNLVVDLMNELMGLSEDCWSDRFSPRFQMVATTVRVSASTPTRATSANVLGTRN